VHKFLYWLVGRRVIEEEDKIGLDDFNFLSISGGPRKVEIKPPDSSEDTYPKLVEPKVFIHFID